MHTDDSLELLALYGHVDPADESVIDAAELAVLAASAPRSATPHRTLRRRRAMMAATSVAAAAAIAVTAVSLTTGTSRAPRQAPPAAAALKPMVQRPVAPGQETILAKLASAVLASPAPAGDATLVLRSQGVGANGQPIPGADLYADSGTYYYTPTEAGLPAQVSAGDSQGDGIFAREIAAATHAATGDLTAAAKEMETAPSPATAAPQQGGPLADNWLWENSMDTLVAGSGNPTVRAGVMRLVSTISAVTVTNATVNGNPALRITATFPNAPKCTAAQAAASSAKLAKVCSSLVGGGFEEQWTIDATTGIPISFSGGGLGQPLVETTYQVSRVTLAQVAQGRFLAAPTTSTPGA